MRHGELALRVNGDFGHAKVLSRRRDSGADQRQNHCQQPAVPIVKLMFLDAAPLLSWPTAVQTPFAGSVHKLESLTFMGDAGCNVSPLTIFWPFIKPKSAGQKQLTNKK